MKTLLTVAVLLSSVLGSVAQAQYVYPAPLVPVYPAPVVAYPTYPTYPAYPAPVTVVPAPVVPVAPAVPMYPVAPNCAWVTVPVSSWQWVQGIFGGWHLRWVTTYQNQLVCR